MGSCEEKRTPDCVKHLEHLCRQVLKAGRCLGEKDAAELCEDYSGKPGRRLRLGPDPVISKMAQTA